MSRYAAFVCAANLLVRVHFLDFFLLRTRRVARYMFLFERYLEDVAKPVHEVLHGHGINPELYLFNWFQMVFFQVLPFPLACRVWDLFLLEGTQVLYRTAAAILLCLHPALVGAPFDRCMLLLTRSGGMVRARPGAIDGCALTHARRDRRPPCGSASSPQTA